DHRHGSLRPGSWPVESDRDANHVGRGSRDGLLLGQPRHLFMKRLTLVSLVIIAVVGCKKSTVAGGGSATGSAVGSATTGSATVTAGSAGSATGSAGTASVTAPPFD